MSQLFMLTEIGYDTSFETIDTLIKAAQKHCSSYNDERIKMLPINTLDKAINYFHNYGFKVTQV